VKPERRDRDGAFEFEPHHCFACGELNEHGLHLQVHTNPEGSWTELTLEPRFEGWESVAHGGIICTLLDEVMAWAVIGRGTWGVTARMNVTFRRPIHAGRAIRAEGWVVEEGGRAARAAGHVIDPVTREVLASGESTFVAVPPHELERLKTRYGMHRVAAGDAGFGSDTTDAGTGSELAAAVGAGGGPARQR